MTNDDRKEQAVREFESRRHVYEKLKGVVVDRLENALREKGLGKKIHGPVSARVKETESFRKKIADKPYADPINDTRDLLGVRIVCLYPSVLDEIHGVIEETFNVTQYEDKGKVDEPDVWRYSSIHYDCELPGDVSGRQDDDITDLVFEIQVRTILQDAWATVEHQLGYKPERPIPDELKREFSALAGLFHVADERFQFIANEIRKLERAQDVAKQLAPLYRSALEGTLGMGVEIEELEMRSDAVINRGSLKVLLRSMYPENAHMRNPNYTKLVRELASADISRLGELGNLLLEGDGAAREQERKHGPLSDVDFARAAISAASPKFQSRRRRRRAP